MTPLLVVITGPTAVGKTDLCVKVAEHFATEIISADSRQFFKELSIGTAKPSKNEMKGIPHHFIHSHSIADDFNVNDFEQETLKLLDKFFKTKKIVLLTGGSGLYIDAVCDGFDEDLPGADETIRKQLENLYQTYGIHILHEKLQQLDPVYFKEVDQSNVKRLYRAIEVCILTGKPYSSLRKGKKQNRPFNIIKIALNRDRQELFDRINQRVDIMVRDGLLDEVKAVLPYKDNNALKTVGYTEIFEHLEGKIPLEKAIENIKVNTRRYAKRQINWFTKSGDYTWFHPNQLEDIIKHISLKLN